MKTIRIGYVGCGFLAQTVHIPNIVETKGAQLLALAELRPKLGNLIKEKYGVPRLYRNHTELAADPDLDAICISAPYAVQGEIARDCLLAGKPVFMEKPMAVSLRQGERIVEAAESSGRLLMIAYMKRYDPGFVLAKEIIDSWLADGERGRLTYMRSHGFCGDWTAGLDHEFINTDEPVRYPDVDVLPEWLPEARAEAYIEYLQQYTHNINLLRWYAGAGDDVSVRSVDLDEDGYRGVVSLDFGGVRGIIESGGLDYPAWEEHHQVYLDRAWVHAFCPALLDRGGVAELQVYDAAGKREPELRRPEDRTWSYKAEVHHFVECVATGAPCRSTGEDALADVRALEDIFRAFLSGRGEI